MARVSTFDLEKKDKEAKRDVRKASLVKSSAIVRATDFEDAQSDISDILAACPSLAILSVDNEIKDFEGAKRDKFLVMGNNEIDKFLSKTEREELLKAIQQETNLPKYYFHSLLCFESKDKYPYRLHKTGFAALDLKQ